MSNQKVIIGLILLLAFTYAKGQDKIITTQEDTIFCKIVSVSPTHIQYEQESDNQNAIGKFISIDQVREYYRNSQFQESFPTVERKKRPKEPFDRWRVGLQGGGAYLLSSFSNMEQNMQDAGIPQSKIDDYNKHLRNGFYVGADVHFLITRFFGVGVKYSLFATSARLDYSLNGFGYFTPDGFISYSIPTYYPISEKDKYYLNYIGPSVVFQHWLDKNRKFRINEELSMGYVRYREEGRFDSHQYVNTDQGVTFLNNALAEGNAFGGSAQVAFEYYPLPWLSVGANAGVLLTSFGSLKTSTKETSFRQDLEGDDRINMSRIDYSVGVRFHF
ncbi:MAG: hypothetical protein FWF53_08940 [Candidatus Azobacteroides sp.]|nr:hypothetical protein [Candidatus Azobacteroides sp.]